MPTSDSGYPPKCWDTGKSVECKGQIKYCPAMRIWLCDNHWCDRINTEINARFEHGDNLVSEEVSENG